MDCEIKANWKQRTSAITIALILNLLDAIAYGLIIFPSLPVFQDYRVHGMCMFLCCTIISQIVFSCLSGFKRGAVAGMMIEIIPYIHKLAFKIDKCSNPTETMPTLIFFMSFSTCCIGLVFLLLGNKKLSALVRMFPRYVLVGAMGGIGGFLIRAGIDLLIGDVDSKLDLQYLKFWVPSVLLAICIYYAQRSCKSSYFIPASVLTSSIIFYAFMWLLGYDMHSLREGNWLFNSEESSSPFDFYKFYQFENINWRLFRILGWDIVAMMLFGLLHVPINVPAFSRSTNQPFSMKHELRLHGISNLLTGIFFACPNYLVYSNSVLFKRAGASTRIDGLLLAVFTCSALFFGSSFLNFCPRFVIISLVLYLGIDLIVVGLLQSFYQSRLIEFILMHTIAYSMMLFGFTEGVVVGLLLTLVLVFYDVSKISIVDQSTATLYAVDDEIRHFRLQGYIFFANCHKVLEELRQSCHSGVFRCIVVDFSNVQCCDMAAMEEFQDIPKGLLEHIIVITVKYKENVMRHFHAEYHPDYDFETFPAAIEFYQRAEYNATNDLYDAGSSTELNKF